MLTRVCLFVFFGREGEWCQADVVPIEIMICSRNARLLAAGEYRELEGKRERGKLWEGKGLGIVGELARPVQCNAECNAVQRSSAVEYCTYCTVLQHIAVQFRWVDGAMDDEWAH